MRREDRREGLSLYEHYKLDLRWAENYKEELKRLGERGSLDSPAYAQNVKILRDLMKIIIETEEKYPEFKV